MKNDKILAAFLVSAGLFSVLQAERYVSGLSQGEKSSLLSVHAVSADLNVTSGSYYGDGNNDNENKK